EIPQRSSTKVCYSLRSGAREYWAVRRREFITGVGGAGAAWPCNGRAQQPAVPVIGFLNSAVAEAFTSRVAAYRRGLGEAGFVEDKNVAIEYRWANGQYDRLQSMAADLVSRR